MERTELEARALLTDLRAAHPGLNDSELLLEACRCLGSALSANSLLCNQKFRELQQRREVQRLEQEIECLKTKLSIPAALGSEFVA